MVVCPASHWWPKAISLPQNCVWDADALRIYMEEAQTVEALTLQELWSLPSFLKLHLAERAISEGEAVLHSAQQPGLNPVIQTCIKSLRELGYADWKIVAEPLILFDHVLRKDPAGAYAQMDFNSREAYRKRVADLAR